VISVPIKRKKYEEYCYSSGVCDEVGRVDEEFSEAVVEDRGEYDLGKNVG
jgi:hypothetical protein